MPDTSELLRSLRIERDDAPPPRRWPRRALYALLVLLAGGAGALLLRQGPVEIATAQARSVGGARAAVLDASGYVVARRQATVSSKVTGKVVELNIEEGRQVRAGEVLARIDGSNFEAQLELAQAQAQAAAAQLAEVQVELVDAERALRRTRELASRQLLSQAALDTAQARVDGLRARLDSTRQNVTVAERSVAVQRQQLDDTVVRAPFDGVITVKNAQPGEMISPLSAGGAGTRTGIGTLVDMTSLEVEVDVNENFINRVTPGQPTLTVLNAYADWKIPSEVIAVIPTADRSKATVKVRIGLKLRDPRVLPDMGARVSFLEPGTDLSAAAPAPVVLAPVTAIQRVADDAAVFVVRDSAVERRAVTLGATRGEEVEIVSGLSGGETLAASALERLDDGTPVRVAAP